MRILIPISLIVVSLALGGWILTESRDGGKDGGGDPGEGSEDDPRLDNDGRTQDDNNTQGPDEDPYDNGSEPQPDGNATDPQDDPADNKTGEVDPPADDNVTLPDEPDGGNETPPSDGNVTDPPDNSTDEDNSTVEPPGNQTGEKGNDTSDDIERGPYLYNGSIRIEDVGSFEFEPWKVRTTRPDIFANGHISIFDILVYLVHLERIEMEYHFDESMDTFVIDSINGTENWWYWAYYSAGWQESNAWRMDLYPYKDNTTITIHTEEDWMIDRIFDSFRSQVERRERNNGKVIIPSVRIESPSGYLEFNDVEVTAHDLRNDSFREGVITAIDVIMSLGDQGLITYDLKWYETIGRADPVKNYWVEAINDDVASGGCGFVYETGEENMGGHNHIHIPSDQRVLTSPEYELFFWICL